MIIKNRSDLDLSELRGKALDIAEAAVMSVLPGNLMRAAFSYEAKSKVLRVNGDTYTLDRGRLFVIGGGKASGLMAQALEGIIGANNITAGVVNCKCVQGGVGTIKLIEAGHPVPDERGIAGVSEMLGLKERYRLGEGDLVICLISGGGSALLPCPVAGVSLADKCALTGFLLGCGAEIGEINALRKHISRIKGGRLGELLSPARVISLIISDVVGNRLDVIASGPTYPDSSTFENSYRVLEKYDLLHCAPESVVRYIQRGLGGEVAETPKSLANCQNYIIGDNAMALQAAATRARELGLSPITLTSEQQGEVGAVARLRANEIKSGKYAAGSAVLIGGETTVRLPEAHGRGGRNQHYAAVSLEAMAAYPGEWVLLSLGTDGTDFLPDVAGAIVDSGSLSVARKKGIKPGSYLERCDSYTLLEKLGNSLIRTGDTGTNVGDVIIYLLK